jgi:hypothetical protein
MKNKPVLIHIPKTAGSSMVRLPWLDYAGHATYDEAVKMFGRERFYFSVVRHPVDRFISCMAVVYQNRHNYPPSIQWICQEDFKSFIERISGRLLDYQGDQLNNLQQVLFRGQYEQIGDIFTIRYEKLMIGLNLIAEKAGVAFNPQNLQHLGAMQLEFPRLSDRARELIAEYYKEDMQKFGYVLK